MAHSRSSAARAVTSRPTPRHHTFSAVQRPASRAALALSDGARTRSPASPKASRPFWARARRLFWSWWVWALLCSCGRMVHDAWGWAAGTGAMALVSYLITPSEFPPRYGLDHEFVGRRRGVPADDGRARPACRFVPGNRIDILNNGDEFYPAMLEAIERRRAVDHHRGLHLLGGRHRPRVRRGAGGEGARQACGSRSCSTRSARRRIGDEILETLEARRLPARLVQPDPLVQRSAASTTARIASRSSSTAASRSPAAPASPTTGAATREDPGEWRDMQIRIEGPAVTPLQTGFAQNWLQTTGELISGPLFYPLPEPAGPLAAQTIMSSPEIGASTVRIMYYLSIICARRSIYIANPYFVPDAAAHRRADRGEAPRRGRADHGGRASTTTTGWRARTACACSARCSRPASRSSNTTARCSITRRWWSTACGRRSARRTSTTDRSRTTKRTTSAATSTAFARSAPRDVRGRHRGLRSRGAGGVEAPRPLAADAGSVRGIPRRADLTRVVRRRADPTSL